jgi:serine/threonine protein kinase
MPALDSFLSTVLRSGLMSKEELEDTLRATPRQLRHDPEALADHLVKIGKLSRFQANKLLQGTAMGLILGPFQVLAPIGKGGMSTVYLARDSRSDLLVALKVLPPKKAREEERLLARFRREMEMSQRVAHPHIAWTYEVGVHQGVYYIAMEYIPGQSLFRIVTDQGPLAVPRAARIFAEIAQALEHAHTQGLIHRDLKPSNILITPHDHAKILDLGLALTQGEEEGDREVIGGQGYVVGTMDYIAPEQAENPLAVDARSDIYSLGCTLYFTLTGRPPFPGGDKLAKILRHRSEDPAPIHQFNPGIPPGFIGLVRRMMARQPDQRIASAAELRTELLRWTTGERWQPMDTQSDREFQEAVSALENSDGVIQEGVPMGIPVASTRPRRKKRRRRRSSAAVLAELSKAPPRAAKESVSAWLSYLTAGILVLALLAGAVGLVLWLRR